MAVTGRPGDMLLSRNPLPPLFTPEEAESAHSVATPTRDLFSDLEQWGIRNWEEEEEEEEGVGRESSFNDTFPHLHTLFMVSTSHLWEVQQLQRGLLFVFSRLVQEAARRFGAGVLGEESRLPRPLCGQCVVTDGRRVSVMWVQVCSLCVGEGGGGGGGGGEGNLVAVERLGPLYEETDMVRGKKRRKVMGFNEDVLRTLLATLLMN